VNGLANRRMEFEMDPLDFLRLFGCVGFVFLCMLGIAMQLTFGFAEREW
jgi:hypothetical protein